MSPVNAGLAASFWLGPCCAFLSSLTWAFGSTRYSQLSARYSPFAINFGRALVAGPLFMVALCITSGGYLEGWAALRSISSAQFGLIAISILASYGLADAIFLWSTLSLGVPGALAVASAYPLWSALGGSLWGGASLGWRELAGILVTLAGIVTVILNAPTLNAGDRVPSPRSLLPHSWMAARWAGVGMAVMTSVFWAINSSVLSKTSVGLSPAAVNVVRMVFALVMSGLLGRLLLPRAPLLLPVREFRAALGLFGYEAFLGSYLFIYGLGHSPLAVGVTLTALAPVLAVPIGWCLKTEKLSFPRTFGVCVVVVGLWLLIC